MTPIALVIVWIFFAIYCGASNINLPSCSGSISSGEYNALFALYNSANGFYWSWNTFASSNTIWTFPSNLSIPCSMNWQGLNCTKSGTKECSISALSLISKNLTGYVPFQINGLAYLKTLDLSGNYLYSTIPSSVFSMSNLETLELASNFFSGTISPSISQLTNLQMIDLSYNSISGPIPKEIRLLGNLESLNIQQNRINGTLPSEIGLMLSLQTLNMNLNKVIGSIPPEIFNATQLVSIDWGSNFFISTIPIQIQQLVLLQQLNIDSNRITGSIPTEIGLLQHLKSLYLNNNKLRGHIPTEIGLMYSLSLLFLESNFLSGPLPSQIGLLSANLSQLAIYTNSITGTIPTEIGLLSNVAYLFLSNNLFSKHIPTQLGNMKNLNELDIGYNILSGPIPTEIGKLTKLQYLFVGVNILSQSIPSQVGSLRKIEYFMTYDNFLTGTIPSEFGSCSKLQALILSTSYISGPIPLQLLNDSNLQYIFLNEIFLSGSIPTSLSRLSNLICFEASLTFISGSLPSALGELRFLQYLEIYDTFLTGTIPSELENCNQLNILSLGQNYLSGTFPFGLQMLRELSQLNISRNMLSGSIPTNPNVSSTIIQSFDISANSFVGKIPTYMMGSQKLTTIVMYSNCFSGSLPEDLCHSPVIEVIVLDSVTSSPSCTFNFPGTLIKGTFPKHFLQGTIPSCLWNMRKLTTLHLSGNGLNGELGEIPSTSALIDLTLSHNHLVGSVPLSVQTHGKFQQLELSFNKLDSTLSSSFVMPRNLTTFDLSVNRLSGYIPEAIIVSESVTILSGNIFTCQEGNAQSIPASDPGFRRYNCGSSNYNRCLYLWVIITAFLVVVYFISRNVIGKRKIGGSFRQFVYDKAIRYAFYFEVLPKQLVAPLTSDFLFLLKTFCICACCLSILYVFICMIIYIILKDGNTSFAQLFSLYSIQYTWITSSAYMHGAVPTFFMLLFLFVTVYIFDNSFSYMYERRELSSLWKYFQRLWRNSNSTSHSQSMSSSDSASNDRNTQESNRSSAHNASPANYPPAPWLSWTCWYRITYTISVQLVYASVTVIVNIAYVYVTLDSVSPQLLNSLQLILGLYKLWYNAMVKPWVVYRIPWLSKSQRLLHMTFMSLFTFIAGPYIATFVTHSNCFRYAILGESSITSTFVQPQVTCHSFCATTNTECFDICDFSVFHSGLVTTDVPAPWLYSYQCSSALLTSFLPVLVLTFLLSGIVIPTVLYMVGLYRLRLKRIHQERTQSYELNPISNPVVVPVSSSSSCSDNPEDIDVSIDVVIDVEATGNQTSSSTTATPDSESIPSSTSSSSQPAHRPTSTPSSPLDNSQSLPEIGKSDIDVIGVPTLISKMILNTSVLMTYGLASPLLGITVAIDGVVVAMFWRGYVENYCRVPPGKIDEAIRYLECTTYSASAGMEGSVFMVILFLALFWSLTMFDFIGDVYGYMAGGCSLLLSLIGIPVFYVCIPVVKKWWQNRTKFNSRPTVVMDSIGDSLFPSKSNVEIIVGVNVTNNLHVSCNVETVNSSFVPL